MSAVAELDAEPKTFETLRAELAFKRYLLARTNPADSPVVTYWASRWGLCVELKSLEEVEAFARKVGA